MVEAGREDVTRDLVKCGENMTLSSLGYASSPMEGSLLPVYFVFHA